MLRKAAMASLKKPKENESLSQEQMITEQIPYSSAIDHHYNSQPETSSLNFNNGMQLPYQTLSFPPARPLRMPFVHHHHHRMHRPPMNLNHFPPRHALRPNFNAFPPQQPAFPMMTNDFVPMQIQPHLNPTFIASQPTPVPAYVDFNMDYTPTPAVRLSPRSAE
jgi:hypothetical protein